MIFIDFECRSKSDLKNRGAWIYSKDPSTQVLVLSYAIDHGEIKTIIKPNKTPKDIQRQLKKGDSICAHNARFENSIWNNTLKWEYLSFNKMFCSLALCAQLNLPRSLDDAAKIILHENKDQIGYKLMLKMCKPRKPTKKDPTIWIESPEMLDRLGVYCTKDVSIERDLYYRLIPYWQESEKPVWNLNQHMNSMGLPIDYSTCKKALDIVRINEIKAKKKIYKLSNGAIQSPNQTKAIAKICGVKSIAKDSIESLINKKGLSKYQKNILKIRRDFGKSSNAKIISMLDYCDTDKRIRDFTIYHGANTGRETGSGPQPLNLPRGKFKPALKTIKAIKKGNKDLTQDQISKAIRLLFKAPKGKEFICSDYAGIEARLVMWLSGETKALNDFRKGKDIYITMASVIFDKPLNSITDFERYVGKQAILGLGYNMGVDRFIATCKGQGVTVEREVATKAVKTYRSYYNKVVKLWNLLNEAITKTIETKVPHIVKGIKFQIIDKTLKIVLLSGRKLTYWNPRIDFDSYGRKRILYKGVNPKTKQWGTLDLYGGKILENIVQATARDLLIKSLLELHKQGFNPILSVYDEILCEEKSNTMNLAMLEKIMLNAPIWANGLPLQTKGWTGKRYRKD